ncbi:MAG: type II secretion system F family protein [Planctomycetes bacterium]|nr:type II secretion system F family protein [Planctomycetota bacterium]
MASYSYKAHDRKSGKEVRDVVEAGSQAEAIAALKKKGLLPIEVKEAKKSARASASASTGGKKSGGFQLFGGAKPSEVTEFTRQLSTLIDAGLPIVQSLQILSDMQRPGKFKNALEQVTEDVQSGTMMSDAMSRYPRIWDRLYTNLIKAGETAGALETILRRLAEFREKAQRLKKTIIGALVYPIAVTVIAVGILIFIMIFIVPEFKAIFLKLEVELPPVTVFLIDMSEFVGSFWYVIVGGAIIIPIAAGFIRRTDAGGAVVDRFSLYIPVIGNVLRKSAVARFSRTLGTLVSSGVGFLDALDITKSATPNIVVRNAVQEVRDSVKEGESINEPLARCGVFNDIVVNMIKVGEETGELDSMLVKIADNYDEEVDDAVAAMTSLLEPILIVFMGGAVGFIVVALFLPLIKIIERLNS